MDSAVVYLARHGQTEWNVQKRWQGQLESPLTGQGRQAATDLAQFAVERDVDAVFSSPLLRARSTAAIAANALGVRLQVLPELAELHHGAMAGLTAPEADSMFPGARATREHDKYQWRFPGGENYADADERAARAISEVEREGCNRALIVSHEMIGRMLLRQAAGWEPRVTLGRRQPHHRVYRVVRSTGEVSELSTDPSTPN
ncbi:histidine phosphatase family protein [Brachybacterium sp. AOP3-A1-3]|uniref:histidine phosphatase family protein n=1 Tax=Brachybacterium sp. AOP3-A1-3 TaxID=3457699 RepID=UPI0040337EC9